MTSKSNLRTKHRQSWGTNAAVIEVVTRFPERSPAHHVISDPSTHLAHDRLGRLELCGLRTGTYTFFFSVPCIIFGTIIPLDRYCRAVASPDNISAHAPTKRHRTKFPYTLTVRRDKHLTCLCKSSEVPTVPTRLKSESATQDNAATCSAGLLESCNYYPMLSFLPHL